MAKTRTKSENWLSFLPIHLKKILSFSAIFLIFLNFFNFSTYFVRQGEVNFHADVARDFFLFEELTQKKIVLIGPRSSTSGIFHGPLWTYLNFPAFLIGSGNAVVVAWYWVLLAGIFLLTSFILINKYFSTSIALAYTLLLSGNLLFQTNSFYNPHGALFLLPAYFITIHKYLSTNKINWLLAHYVLGGLIIQFQMAVGIPLVIISILITLIITLNKNNLIHLLSFLALPLTLINFIVFEIRHNFNMTKAILGYTSPSTNGSFYNYTQLFQERLGKLVDLQLTPGMPEWVKLIIFLVVLAASTRTILNNKKLATPLKLLITYVGLYILLTFVNKGAVLLHQIFPIYALTTLWVAILLDSKCKEKIVVVLAVVVFFNLKSSSHFVVDAKQNFFNVDVASWKFQTNIAKEIAKNEVEPFGYFVYSPDVFAYSSRYALKYQFKTLGIHANEYQKLATTYIVAAPAPPDRPDLSYKWWRQEKVGIKKAPEYTKALKNGYILEKYSLNPEEQAIPHDPLINIGIHFR